LTQTKPEAATPNLHTQQQQQQQMGEHELISQSTLTTDKTYSPCSIQLNFWRAMRQPGSVRSEQCTNSLSKAASIKHHYVCS
jgi:hypothetical protein